MWMLDNQTEYQAERTWVRDENGAHQWIVVVKATYDIDADGSLSLSEDPVEPLYVPEYSGADGESSIRYEADLVAMKPATDVYLNATAFAPRGRPCGMLDVSIQVGPVRKALRVYGDRTWGRRLSGRIGPSSPEPFEAMPITYERAFGGYDAEHPNPKKHRLDLRNPVGTGVARSKRNLIGKPAPSVVDPRRRPRKQRVAGGFGALASHWSPRREFAGTYDEQWATERKPLLPGDYDPRCLLSAPIDQQVRGYLKGGELVELSNLTPSGRIRFELPKASQRFETFFGSTRKEHVSRLVTVVIDTDVPRLILVWQTSLPCGNDADYLDQTVIWPAEASG